MKILFTLCFIAFTVHLMAQNVDSNSKVLVSPEDSIFKKVEVEASFPGGEQAWTKYIQREIEIHIDKLSRNKASNGTCEVMFIVGKDGSTTNVEALTLKKSLLAKILIDAIKNGPRWNPAIMNGKPVKAWRRQKITFRAPD